MKKALAIAACFCLVLFGLFALGPSSGPRNVHLFSGSRGAMAYSADRSGRNLPAEYRPWKFIDTYSRSDPAFWFGRDRRSLAEVDERGYSLAIFEVVEEPPSPLRSSD